MNNGWVIECKRGYSSKKSYLTTGTWDGYDWTHDSHEAITFKTKEIAVAVLANLITLTMQTKYSTCRTLELSRAVVRKL